MASEPATNRLGELLDAVLKASRGDMCARAPISPQDDGLNTLAQAINRLIVTLSAHVTGAARAREARLTAEERYRRLESIIPGIVYTFCIDADGVFHFPYATAACRDLIHVDPEDLMRDASLLAGLIHPDDRERRDQSIQESFETFQFWRQELRHIVDGEVRWFDCMSRPELQADGSVLWYGLMLDITQRKRAEEALRESEAKIRRLLESMRDAFVVTDIAGRIIECNRAYEEMLGRSPEELIGCVHQDLTPPKWQPLVQGIVKEQVLPRGFSDVYEKEYLRKDGSSFPVELRAFLLHDQAGVPAGMWHIVRDITDRKRAEQDRARLEARLADAQKMESIGRLAGGVAHDFNNMLTVIQGFTELVLQRMPPGDPLRQYMAEIEKAANHSRDITTQLLAFSRRQIVARRPMDLNQLISSKMTAIARLIGEDIDFRFVPAAGSLCANVDPAQIQQILINLAVNARDAMPKGGTLSIETDRVSIDEAYCRAQPEFTPGDYVLLTVADTGVGMDRETLAHCFEPFFTTKQADRGSGLGLATVYGIVKQNGGFLNVYSEPGLGTAFRIYLPEIVAEAGPVEAAPETAALRGHGVILLVEDQDMVRASTEAMLRDLGYTVLSVGSPAEAVALCLNGKTAIDLLLTDVVMPGMSGVELRDRILGALPDTKVLFMSGFTSDDVLRRGVAEEGLHFVQKPFGLADLARAVRAALG